MFFLAFFTVSARKNSIFESRSKYNRPTVLIQHEEIKLQKLEFPNIFDHKIKNKQKSIVEVPIIS